MRIAGGGREKPFVTAQQVCATAPTRCHRRGRGGVGAHIRAALLFRHAHTDPQRCFLAARQVTAVITGAEQPWLELRPQRRLLAQQPNRRRSHGGGAQRALLHLSVQVKARSPGTEAARLRIVKRQADQALRAVHAQQGMPRGMKLHRFAQAPACIKALQLRASSIGPTRQLPRGGRPEIVGIPVQLRHPGLRPRAHQCLLQGWVSAQQVHVPQLIKLVVDFVRFPRVHGTPPRRNTQSKSVGKAQLQGQR